MCSILRSCFDAGPALEDSSKDDKRRRMELFALFEETMRVGVDVDKLSSDREKYKVRMAIINEELTFQYPPNGDGGGLPGDSDPECVTQKIARISIRRATDPDPHSNEFAGSEVLRSNLDPRDALRAFILEAATDDGNDTIINILCDTEEQAEELITGFRTLIKKRQIQLQ
uniref:Uncharacterized protein n=1 Tax=Octactis speculum TaxID=3111310 RepID=A0A7S2GP89_9STRA|mmetsp:Transcript_51931/g.70839  ORF Transcript_51931/g.70839 Transcript_51931/m.70839 type:complete len:171 (+) Transcript_51931:44-556(+)